MKTHITLVCLLLSSISVIAQKRIMIDSQWAVIKTDNDTCFQDFSYTSEDEDKLIEKAEKKLNKQKYSKAIPLFEEVLKINDKNAEAHAYLGDMYARRSQHSLAIHHYSEAIAIEPCNDAFFYKRGLSHIEMEGYSAAAKDLTQARLLNDQNDLYAVELGKAQLLAGNAAVGCDLLDQNVDLLHSITLTLYEHNCPADRSE